MPHTCSGASPKGSQALSDASLVTLSATKPKTKRTILDGAWIFLIKASKISLHAILREGSIVLAYPTQ